MILLKNWAVISNGSPYSAPETIRSYLVGEVYGHPEYADGDRVKTSQIIGAKGRKIQCKTREYLLDGGPEQEYEDFCNKHNIPIDLENPIKVKTLD